MSQLRLIGIAAYESVKYLPILHKYKRLISIKSFALLANFVK